MPTKPTTLSREDQSRLLRQWLTSRGFLYSYATDGWMRKLPHQLPEHLPTEYVIDFATIYVDREQITLTPRQMISVLNLWAHEQRRIKLTEMNEMLTSWTVTEKEADVAWRAWADAVCEEGHEYSIAVMRHFMWQVRRKMINSQVANHIVPVFRGETRGGKSREIDRLLKPVHDLVSYQTIDQIIDERHYIELGRHFVVYIDEMAGARKAEMSKLKYIITAAELRAHRFFSQKREAVQQKATFIASSNFPVSVDVRDSSSGRRYWEIRCKPKIDWDAAALVSPQTLWGSVDPMLADGYVTGEMLERISELQHDKLRAKPDIEYWAADAKIQKGATFVPTRDLWAKWVAWCDATRCASGTQIKFSRLCSDVLKLPRGRGKGGEKGFLCHVE